MLLWPRRHIPPSAVPILAKGGVLLLRLQALRAQRGPAIPPKDSGGPEALDLQSLPRSEDLMAFNMDTVERVRAEFEATPDPAQAMAHAIIDLRQKLKVIRRRLHGGGVSAADMMASLHRIFIGDLAVVGWRDEGDGPPEAWEKLAEESERMRLCMVIRTVERAASHYGIELTPANLEDPGISVTPTDACAQLWEDIREYAAASDLPKFSQRVTVRKAVKIKIDRTVQLLRNEAIAQALKGEK